MHTSTLFAIPTDTALLHSLMERGFYLPALRELGHGMALWTSRSSVYSIEITIQDSEVFAPFSITILQRAAHEEIEQWEANIDEYEVMAACELGPDFSIRSAQFQNGLASDDESFVTYLKMVLDDIDAEPTLCSDFDLEDEDDLLIGVRGEKEEVFA